ncbi:MAG: hypothetical protein LBL37_03275, partial [Gracilibacteraceae bacterium]|nr:hypothetical protein [Gracilibacteraceae bacterium]
MNWQQICNENEEFFLSGNWTECGEKDRKALKLPSGLRFLSAGGPDLKMGAVVAEGKAREDGILTGGLLWADGIGGGVPVRLFFVAPSFSREFLSSLGQIGGRLSPEAVMWREKL